MQENESRDIAPEEKSQPLAIADGLLNEEAIRRAELMVDGVKKIKAISAKVTNPNDWTIQNGNPYLQNTGCMKIAQLWGVNFLDRKFVPEGGELREDEKGSYYLFTVEGRAEFKGRIVEDVGTCSTRDDFFGTRKEAGIKAYKPLGEVDIENIKKKAVTNLQGRLLKKILGLSYTMEELNAAGVILERSTQIKYASGGAGGGKISEAQGKLLFAVAMHGTNGPEDKKSRELELKKHLKETYQLEHSRDIGWKDYEAIVAWAKQMAASRTVGA